MLTFCLFLASLAYLSCRLWTRDFAPGSVAVGVERSCRQSLGIHTPRVLGVGVRNVPVQQRVTFAMIGRWPSGNRIIVSVLMLNAVNHLAAILSSPLDQPPIPRCPRHPSQEPLHPTSPSLPPSLPPSEGPGIGGETLSDDLKRPRVSSPPLSMNKQGGMRTGGWLRMGILLPFPFLRRGEG